MKQNFIKFYRLYKVWYNVAMNEYANKLRRILSAADWSQEVLAGKLEVSFVTLNSWINGRSVPREQARERIDLFFAEILGQDSINTARLAELKKRAGSQHYTARKLISNRRLLERITTSLTYHSNGTEGSTMTEQDVTAVIYDGLVLQNRTQTEQREALNHQTALYFLLDELGGHGDDFEFTPELVKGAHLRLMNGIISNAGVYRNHGVRIRGAAVPLANYLKIPVLVKDWCISADAETMDKIELLARTHAAFERIHPFSDGNGRLGRLLLFVLALKLELVPPVLRKERRFAYYKYLELAQTREITDPLEMFIAEEILKTAEQLEG